MDATRADARAWGIETTYTDALGERRTVSDATVTSVLDAMGAVSGTPGGGPPGPAAGPATAPGGPVTVRLDRPLPALPGRGAGRLRTEDGGEQRVEGRLPPDLPPGYHRLELDGEPTDRLLVASPGRCPAPPAGPQWGWAAQLYATRSRRSWGMGDLGDLAELTRWSASLGAGVTLINPLHAGAPVGRQEPSPYFPASRCFPHPLYLRVEDLPGAAETGDVDQLAEAGRALNGTRRIDRDRVWALKSPALEAVYAGFAGDPELDIFVERGGPSLAGFATWCALAERHGLPWQDWPAELRHPEGTAVAAFVRSRDGAARVRFYEWLQWHLDRQLAGAAGPVGLMQDLAIGVDAGGADAWLWQDAFAAGARVGAPPDEFNSQGQDWGLPPWDPWKLRAAEYEPFVQTVRAGLRHAGGLRFDHVMGLFRLWWIPDGRAPADGAYVRYPATALLDILALEAHRAGAYVVGEDLGTVEPGVRTELAERGVLSYRLLWFEADPPAGWPGQALGAVTTHDLPTVAGVWTGSDLADQRRLGLQPSEEGARRLRERLSAWTGSAAGAPVDEVVTRTYRLLAGAPCAVLTATLEDACGVPERPNMPGTVDEWPNWSLALPLPLEDIERLPLAGRIARALAGRAGAEGRRGAAG